MEKYTREQLEPAELVLKCMVPVFIVMDGDTVRKVVVADEELDTSTAELVEHSSVRGDADLEKARLNHAIAMAEDSYWPSWDFGW